MTMGVLALGFVSETAKAQRFEDRSYKLFVPKAAKNDPQGLVVVLHGGKSDAKGVRRYTNFDRAARQYEVIALYPNAPDRAWNDGRDVPISNTDSLYRDDAGYLVRLVQKITARRRVNPQKVFAIGISNGGGMAFRLACEYPDMIAGIGLVTTKLHHSYQCENGRPIPAILFYGTEDTLSPHDGRSANANPEKAERYGAMLSADDTIAYWKRRNRCTRKQSLAIINTDPDDDTQVQPFSFQGCAAPLKYYEIIGGGHTWPGAPRRLGARLLDAVLGKTSQDINANDEALKFWLVSTR